MTFQGGDHMAILSSVPCTSLLAIIIAIDGTNLLGGQSGSGGV